MELVAGEFHIAAAEDFPEHISPFPEPSDLLYDETTTSAVHLPKFVERSQPPLQKLRPIRCNGRNPGEYSDLSVAEVGFTVPLPLREIPLDGNSGDYKATVELGDFPESGAGAIDGNAYRSTEILRELTLRSTMEGAEFSSASDDGSYSSKDITQPPIRKRKRKERENIKLFIESLIRKVMSRQEQMHNQLVERIEKMEQERIMREEAWKQQEMERAKEEQEAKAQETSRSLALISFIQKALGREIQIPQSFETSGMEEDESQMQSPKDFKHDPNSRRWPKSEVQALITLRTALDHKFHMGGPKYSIWEEVSVGLANMGYMRTAKKCKEKWENINKYFRRSIWSGKTHQENARTCPYFHELDLLYKSGLLNLGNPSNDQNDETGDKNTKD